MCALHDLCMVSKLVGVVWELVCLDFGSLGGCVLVARGICTDTADNFGIVFEKNLETVKGCMGCNFWIVLILGGCSVVSRTFRGLDFI